MTITADKLRLDLKCGKGAISKGEKCRVGPASEVQQNTSTPKGRALSKEDKPKISTKKILLGAYAASIAYSLYTVRNQRQAYDAKFGGEDRVTPLDAPLGNIKQALENFKQDNQGKSAPSMFGTVVFGEYEGKAAVLKTINSKVDPAVSSAIEAARSIGMYTDSAADNMLKGMKNITKQEVDHARIAGENGFGPRIIAADDKRMFMDRVVGRPLASQDRTQRFSERLQKTGNISILAELSKRNLVKGTEISDVQKNRVLEAMGKMHSAGFAHNDLHPNNIFVSDKGAQFIDYGASSRGGRAVAHEFVQMMNKPRTGLSQLGGMGYNLKSVDPEGYKQTAKEISKIIGKKVGKLTAADIAKAKSNDPEFENKLQQIIDDYYVRAARRNKETPAKRSRTDSSRLDLKCGSGHIAQGKKCRKGVGAPNNIAQAPAPPSTKPGSSRGRKIAIGAALAGATALGAGLTIASSRKQILNAPEAVRRAAQKGVTEVVHRATSPKPSMKFSSEGPNGMVKDLKKRSLRRKMMLTMEAARRKQEPGYRKPPLKLTAGSVREPRKGGKQRSVLRKAQLTMEAARRKQEPGYRKPRFADKRKDAAARVDKKCGKSAIADNKKCSKQTQQRVITGVIAGAALTAGGVLAYNKLRSARQTTAPTAQSTPAPRPTAQPTPVSRPTPASAPRPTAQPTPVSRPTPAPAPTAPKTLSLLELSDFAAGQGLKINTSNTKHNYVMGTDSAGNTVGYASTPKGNLITFKRGKMSDEVGFTVNGYHNKHAKQDPKETIAILSKVERMLQKSIEKLPDDTTVWAGLSISDGLGDARAKLYRRYGFNVKDNEAWTTVGEIKKRSRRTDAWVGNDKKLKCGPGSKPCGNACIPKKHKCRASWNKPVKALKAGAVIAGAGLVGTALFHKRANMRSAAAGLGEPVMHGGFALGNIAMGNRAQAAKNAANAMSSAQNFRKNVTTLRKGYGQDVGSVYAAAKRAVFKARHHRQARG